MKTTPESSVASELESTREKYNIGIGSIVDRIDLGERAFVISEAFGDTDIVNANKIEVNEDGKYVVSMFGGSGSLSEMKLVDVDKLTVDEIVEGVSRGLPEYLRPQEAEMLESFRQSLEQ